MDKALRFSVPGYAAGMEEGVKVPTVEALESIPEDRTAVVALDASAKDRLSELLPGDHPLTLLLDSRWEGQLSYQREIAVLLSQPAQVTRNLALHLSAGTVRPDTIGGRDYTAIFA